MGITAKKQEKRTLLSHEETLDLIDKVQRTGDEQAKEILIENNLGLVRSVVSKFLNIGYDRDDLFQLGSIGLIKAIYKFDPRFNVKFSTYAVPMILGEIKRYLRDNSAFRVTRSLRDLSYLIAQTREKYVKEHNEEPTIDKICELTKAAKEDVILAIDSTVAPMSIYDCVYNDGGDQIYLLDQLKNEKEESENTIDKIAIEQVLGKLSDKEKYIITKRYFNDKTQSELAEELGVSQAQISRIEKNALERMKKRVEKGI